MALTEINFDGIIGPSHNYAGLSIGNLASTSHHGDTSRPRAAALQGIEKMRSNLQAGLSQGILLPLLRPNAAFLEQLSVDLATASPVVRAAAWSASSMWAANAATVSPAPDTADGRCHLTVANLRTMPHRSHEWPGTRAQLRVAFGDQRHFTVHDPVPPAFGDEGAANHMRLAGRHGEPGVEVFVYGVSGGPFPARQHVEASRAVARRHRLNPERTLFVAQSEAAIAAGAFHNDVVAVANESVLLAHEHAFADKDRFYADMRRLLPEVDIIEVPAAEISLADAVRSYLFNAQLVTQPDGGTALVLPEEARDTPAVWTWAERLVAGNGPVRALRIVDVRQSMANGGGPACLRLRVVADPATIDPRFLVDEARLDAIAETIKVYWPEHISPSDLADPRLAQQVLAARAALLARLDLNALL